MDSNRPTGAGPAPAPAEVRESRVFFLDRLRAALVILVILHHVALVYGAAAPFYYVEPPVNDPSAFLVLLVFALVNQAWFMGALFAIAGYFTPGSFDRRGAGPFIRRRLFRLGVPLLFFSFVLGPVSAIGYWQMPASITGISVPLTWAAYPHLVGMGPMWFVAMLLVFDLGYAAWRPLAKRPVSNAAGESSGRSRGYGFVVSFILLLAVASYLLRIVVPMGKTVLGFPTLSYLPQYLGFFVLGANASRRGWLRRMPRAVGLIAIGGAVLATVVLFPLAFSGHAFSMKLSQSAAFLGDGHWQSAVYALWDSLFAVSMVIAAVALFRRLFNGQSRLGTGLSLNSYAVYVIHTPIVVFIAVALKGVHADPLSKFGIAALLAVPVCYAAAYAIRGSPYVKKVL